MNIKLTALLLALSVIISCNKSPESGLKNISQKLKNKKSVHYKLKESYYYTGEKDTIKTNYELYLLRVPTDSVVGGYAWIENYYRPYSLVYTLKEFYVIYPTKQKVRLYPTLEEPLVAEADWSKFFFKPQLLEKLQTDTTVSTTVKDTVVDGKECLFLLVNTKNNQTDMSNTYFIDKKTGFPVKTVTVIKRDGNEYNNILEFSDVEYVQVDTAAFNKKLEKYKKLYPPLKFESGKTENIYEKMLQTGEKAPIVNGSFYRSGQEFNLENYIGKNIIILDFWYTHCPPCVKAIPELSAFYDEYKDKGLVIFGMNSIDNKPGNDEYLLNFCKNKGMSYEPIRTKSTADLMYKVVAYPTMYVIDKQGNIVYSEVGFSKDKFEELKKEVISLLEKK